MTENRARHIFLGGNTHLGFSAIMTISSPRRMQT